MPTPGASTSSCCSSAGVQQEDVSPVHLLLPIADGHGCTAPPPTPMAASLPCSLPTQYDDSPPLSPVPPFNSKLSAAGHGFLQSDTLASQPSKEDLDALARFLMQQSLHATPHLLASPPIRRKRPPAVSKAEAAIKAENDITSGITVEEEADAAIKGHDMNLGEEELVTYSSYCGGFSDETKQRIGKACREVGTFYIQVLPDAGSAIKMVQGITCSADDASVVQGGRVPISEVLTSTSQQHQYDALDLNLLALDAAADTNFRETLRMLLNSLWTISKDLLQLLLRGLSDETQAQMKGDFLKPLVFICDDATQHSSRTDTVISLTSHDHNSQEDSENALFHVAIGPQLQTWSQGEYKAPVLETSSRCTTKAIGIQFVLVRDQ